MRLFSLRRQRRQRVSAAARSVLIELLESRTLLSFPPSLNCIDDIPAGGHIGPYFFMGNGKNELAPMPDAQRSAAPSVAPAGISAYSTLPNGMPILHSRPSAPAAIFVDFDGDGSTTPYDIDGNSSSFNTAEQDNIAECWRQMCMYYNMFDIDITTIQPNTTTMPTAWIAVGNNISGGYSYVGVFPNGGGAMSWDQSSDINGRVSAVAHEIGHNLGLWHTSSYDLLGNKTAEYAWAADELHGPMMGVDFSGVIHKWTVLHDSGSPNSLQDDMGVIAGQIREHASSGYTGDGYAPDDFGNTIATATAMSSSGITQSITGIIERSADTDVFSFIATGARYSITAGRENPSGVDIKLLIYNSAGNLVAAEDGDPVAQPMRMVNDAEILLNLSAGNYYASVQSHGNYADLGQYNIYVNPVADGWNATDVGLTGWPGYTSYNSASSTWTVAGSGSDIWGTSDALQNTFQQLSGDGSIVARIASMTNTDGWAKSGVMIRESLNADAKDAAMLMSYSNGLQFLWRAATAGDTAGYHPTPNAFTPTWLKLTRAGNSFSAYKSSDGSAWTQWGATQTIAMNSTVYIGLVSSAHNNGALNTATFTNVSLTGNINPAPTINGLPAPTGLAVTISTASTISLSWTDISNETGYVIERSSDGANFEQVAAVAANLTTYTDTNLQGFDRYFYRVRAQDASGVSNPSTIVNGVTRAAAVTNLSVTSWTNTQLILNWTDSSGESSYRIERSPNGTNTWTTAGTVGQNITCFTDSNLVTATTYYYRLVTIDSSGDSATTAVVSRSTRLPVVTGLAFTSKTATQFVIQWTDIAGETSYRIERSTDGSSYSTLATVNANITTYTDNTVAALGEFYYRVVAVSASTEGIWPTPLFAAAPAASALPSPWVSQDIGSVNGTGAAGYSSGTYTVVGNGSDIWNNADAFRFTYVAQSGDSTITAHVASIENTDSWAKSGVMIRESTSADSKFVMVCATPGNGVNLQWRDTTAGTCNYTAGPGTSGPYWVRIVRAGNTFTGYASANGSSWSSIGSLTIAMAANVYAGLAVTSHNTGALNTSSFDNVSIQATVPAAPTNLLATKLTGRTVRLTWTDNSINEDGFYVETSTDGNNWSRYATVGPAAGSGSTVTYTTGSFPAGRRYFRVLAYNSSGASAPSNRVTLKL